MLLSLWVWSKSATYPARGPAVRLWLAGIDDMTPPDHGRIEPRRIWCSSVRNNFLDFPHVRQVFTIEREIVQKKTGVVILELFLASPVVRQKWTMPNTYTHSIAGIGR